RHKYTPERRFDKLKWGNRTSPMRTVPMFLPLLLPALALTQTPEPPPAGQRAPLTDGPLFVPAGFRADAGGVELLLHLHGGPAAGRSEIDGGVREIRPRGGGGAEGVHPVALRPATRRLRQHEGDGRLPHRRTRRPAGGGGRPLAGRGAETDQPVPPRAVRGL